MRAGSAGAVSTSTGNPNLAAGPAEESPRTGRSTTGITVAGGFLMISVLVLGVAIAYAADAFAGAMIVAAAFFGWRGFNCGIVKCVFSLSAAVAMFAWAVPLGKMAAGRLRLMVDWPTVPIRHLGVLTAAFAILAVGQVLGWWFQRRCRRRYGRTGSGANALGMGLGFLEGAVLACAAISAILAVEPPARMGLSLAMDRHEWAAEAYSQVMRLEDTSRSLDLRGRLGLGDDDRRRVLELGGALALISKYPTVIDRLKTNPVIVALMAEFPALDRVESEIRGDWDLKAAVKAGDVWGMLDSPTVLRIMEDSGLARDVGQHYDVLFDAMLAAIPAASKDQAFTDIARLHGRELQAFVPEAELRRSRGNQQRMEHERWFGGREKNPGGREG